MRLKPTLDHNITALKERRRTLLSLIRDNRAPITVNKELLEIEETLIQVFKDNNKEGNNNE